MCSLHTSSVVFPASASAPPHDAIKAEMPARLMPCRGTASIAAPASCAAICTDIQGSRQMLKYTR